MGKGGIKGGNIGGETIMKTRKGALEEGGRERKKRGGDIEGFGKSYKI